MINWKKDKYLIIGLSVAVLSLISIFIFVCVYKEGLDRIPRTGNEHQRSIRSEIEEEPIRQQQRPVKNNRPVPAPRKRRDPPPVEVKLLDRGGNKPSLVLFYSLQCGHCKSMMGDWENVNKILPDMEIDVITLEASQNNSEIRDHGIRGFPTIKFYPEGFPNNQNVVEYQGDRTSASIINFAQSGGARV